MVTFNGSSPGLEDGEVADLVGRILELERRVALLEERLRRVDDLPGPDVNPDELAGLLDGFLNP